MKRALALVARWRCLLALVMLGALGACTAMPERLQPGLTRTEIEQRLGPPTATYALAHGIRLQYSRQPAGQQVYNLDLDRDNRLESVEQVLDAGLLQRIEVDRWTQAEVLRFLGRPALVERVARFDGDIWTYRYLEGTWARQLHVHLDPAGVVRRVLHTDEPLPDDRDLAH